MRDLMPEVLAVLKNIVIALFLIAAILIAMCITMPARL